MVARAARRAVAHIAFGWEERSFYEKSSAMPRDLAREMARETTEGALDPLNPQSQCAPELLRVFREMIALDGEYVARLKRHYDLFRQTLSTTGNPQHEPLNPGDDAHEPYRLGVRKKQRFFHSRLPCSCQS